MFGPVTQQKETGMTTTAKKYATRHTVKVKQNTSQGCVVWGVYINNSIVGGWHHKKWLADTLASDIRSALSACLTTLPNDKDGEFGRRDEDVALSRMIETVKG